MKLSLETITHNLNLLEEVKKEYPILQDYQDGKIRKETIHNVGLDNFINLIDSIKSCEDKGIKLIYTETIKYKDLKDKFIELNYNEKSKKIFGNKSKKDFEELWNNYKLHQRYKRGSNDSYAPGMEATEPMIINYLVQNNVEVYGEFMFYRDYWFYKFTKPKYYSRELKMTQDFVESFLNYAKEANLDLRKCNVKSLTTELQFKLKELTTIEEGLQVKCISEIGDFRVDNIYTVKKSHINYLGFVEVNLIDDKGESRNVPYSNFEEISRQRDDLLSQLGII
jgi:hypothetical protein